jgi:hypothetical protein
MKKVVMLPLVAAVSGAMVGCGGGGGGGTATPPPAPAVYKWQIVDLYSIERSKVQSGCAIFANDEAVDGNVIAARVADTNFRILFHDANGRVEREKTIEDIPNSGLISIRKDSITPNGYVALEETSGLVSGMRESYIFGVQQPLMQDMTIAIRNEQATSNDCYRGEWALEDNTNPDAVVSVAVAGTATTHYRTSASAGRTVTDSSGLDLGVVSGFPALERKLVTAYSNLGSSLTNLTHYGIIVSEDVYDKTAPPVNKPIRQLTDSDLMKYAFASNNIVLDDNSAINVVMDNHVYSWQPINDQLTEFSYAATEANLTNWAAEIFGKTTSNWNYVGMYPVSSQAITVTPPTVTDFSSTSIVDCGGDWHCVSSASYNASDFSYQRTAIRAKTEQDKNFYQSIYSLPSNSQVILESPSEIVAPSTSATDTVEVGLMKVTTKNHTDAAFSAYLMKNSLDMQDNVNVGNEAYSDFNGRVVLPTVSLKEDISLMTSNYSFVTNKNN